MTQSPTQVLLPTTEGVLLCATLAEVPRTFSPVECPAVTRPKDDSERWERNERIRRRRLEHDRKRPPAELLAETIELSRVAMKLRVGAAKTRGG